VGYTIDTSKCRRKVLDLYGARGQQWLDHFSELAMEYVQRWKIKALMSPYPNESYSFVAPAVCEDGTAAVLKIGFPDRELRCQIENLRLCGGQGLVRLLESDEQQCAMLMEQILPGSTLESLGWEQDERITETALSVMHRLWQPAPLVHEFQHVSEWATHLKKLRVHFNGGVGPFPAHLVERAEGLFRDLLFSGPVDAVLIHGDMNPGNILLGQNGWVAIDPKGVVGDPLYDVATFLNYIPKEDTDECIRALLDRRVRQAASFLGEDPAVIRAWGQAHAVLAGWWQYEDHNGQEWEPAFRLAGIY